jgi:hypothetical protein
MRHQLEFGSFPLSLVFYEPEKKLYLDFVLRKNYDRFPFFLLILRLLLKPEIHLNTLIHKTLFPTSSRHTAPPLQNAKH